MPIRKNRLFKICIKCKELFEPTGRFNRVCDDCNPHVSTSYWHRLQRLSRNKQKGGPKGSHN